MTDPLYTNNAPVLQEAFEAGYRLEAKPYEQENFGWRTPFNEGVEPNSLFGLAVKTQIESFCESPHFGIRLAPNQDLYGHHIGKVNREWLLKHPLPAYIVSAMIICLDGSAMPQEYINEKREVMRAFNLGKTIQSRPDETCEWFDCYAPRFESHLQFRVAPNQDFKPKGEQL